MRTLTIQRSQPKPAKFSVDKVVTYKFTSSKWRPALGEALIWAAVIVLAMLLPFLETS